MLQRFPKKLKFGADARDSLLRGINLVADAVETTLGLRGRNVAINQPYGPPLVLHDGVSVAKSVDLTDPFEDMGAQLIKSAAQKTNDKAGDGTTTATILSRKLAVKGIEMVASGVNPTVLKSQIEAATSDVLKELSKISREIKNQKEAEQIATISSTDPEIGKLVSEAVFKVGKEGVITVEEGGGIETKVDYASGMEIDRGYMSSQFVTNAERTEAEIEDCYVLITDKKLVYNFEIFPFLEKFFSEAKSKNLLIFVEDIQDEALASLIINHTRGAIKCAVVKAPQFGTRRTDELWDIATLTGGVPILSDSGRDLGTVQVQELGRASKVRVTRDKTIITGGMGNPDAIKKRVSDIQEEIKKAETGYDLDIRKERLAKMVGGVAVIKVGGITEVEIRDKKERVIDAVNATRAAVEEGVVPGGEITPMYLSNLPIWSKHNNPGGNVLKETLRSPFRVLVENAGIDYADAWNQVMEKNFPFGIDVVDGKVKNMLDAGIIDPTKVLRSAIENAVSVSTMVLTTNVLISEPIEENIKK